MVAFFLACGTSLTLPVLVQMSLLQPLGLIPLILHPAGIKFLLVVSAISLP